MKRNFYLLLILMLVIFTSEEVNAQCEPCSNVTTIDVDLSSSADSTWTYTGMRNGQCCGQTGNTRCIRFNVNVHPQTNEIAFNVANPAPPGGAFYQLNCGTETSLGTQLCVTNMTSFCIVFCKSGGDAPNYTISASRTFNASADLTVRQGCTGMLTVDGLIESSINWNSVYPGTAGSYNTWLSCTSGCDTTFVSTPYSPTVVPSYIDYEVIGTATGCASGTSRDTVRMYLVTGMEVTVDPAEPVICTGNEVTLTATPSGGSPPFKFLWSTGDTTQSVTVTAGTYAVSVSDNSFDCPPVVDSVTVIQSEQPEPPVLGSNSPFCAGETINLTATAAPGATYQWSGPNGFLSIEQNPSIPNAAPADAGIYDALVIVNGCLSSTATVNVDVILNTDVSVAENNGPVCEGESITLSASGIPGAIYHWTGPEGFSETGASVERNNLTISQAGYYTVTAFVNDCPGMSDSTFVIINPLPSAPLASNNGPVCAGETITLSASGISDATYNWTGPNNFSATGETINISGTYSSHAGNYTVTAIVNGCAGSADTTSVIIHAIPETPLITTNSPVCEGNTIFIEASGVQDAVFNWSGPDGFSASGEAQSISNASFSNEGTYSVIATVNGCISPVGSTEVLINLIPVVPSASDETICAGETATLTALASAGTIEWFANETGGIALATGETFNTPVLSETTTYYVQTIVNDCPSARTAVTVNVTPIPAAPTADGTTICEGLIATLIASAPGGTYEWFDATTNGNLLVTGDTYSTPELTETTTYYVQTTVNGCTSKRTAVTVEVLPTDDPAFNFASGTYCITGINAIPNITGGYTGTFSASPAGLVFVSTTTGEVNVADSDLNTYTITFTTDGPCPASSDAEIAITDAPDATFSYAAPFCQFDENPLPDFSAGASAGLFSASPAGLEFVSTSSGEIDLQNSLPGTYTITNYIEAAFGCTAESATFEVTIDSIAIVHAGNDITICAGETAMLSGSASGSATSGSWSGGTGVFSPNENTLNASYLPSTSEINTGYVDLILTSNNPSGSCESATDTVRITINPIPAAPSASDETNCAGETTTLTASASAGTIEWFANETGGIALATGETFNTPVLNETITYYIQTIVNDCPSARTAVTVNVTPIPAAPTADGTTICEGLTTSLVATAPGGNYEWFDAPTEGNLMTTGDTYNTPELTETTTYFVQTTVNGCTSNLTAVTVDVLPTDDPAFNFASGTYCITGSNAIPNITGGFSGTFSASPAGLVFVSTTTGEVNVADSDLNTYTFTFTTDGPCQASSDADITITDAPNATFSYDTPFCQFDNNTFPNFSAGASAGVFSASPAGLEFINTSSGEIDLQNSLPGTYTVTNLIEAAFGCAEASGTFEITIDPVAVANAGNDITICAGETAMLTGSVSGSAISGSWSGGTGVFSPNGNTLNASYLPSTSEINAGYVDLILTSNDPAGPCELATDTVKITINPIPVAPTVSDTTICAGESATLSATSPGGIYSWYNATNNLIHTGAEFSTGALTETTTYDVTSTEMGCEGPSTSVTVEVTPMDDSTFSYVSSTYCITGINPLPDITGGFPGVFSSTPSGLSFVDETTGEINLAGSATDTYTIKYLTTGACPNTASQSITITTAPDATFTYDSPLCQYGNNALPIFPAGASAGEFSATPSGIIFEQTSTGSIDLMNSIPGTYTITNYIASASGCAAETDSFTVTIDPVPTVNAGADQTICAGQYVQLNGSFGGAASSATWSGNGIFSPSGNDLNAAYTPTQDEVDAGQAVLILTTNDPLAQCAAVSDSMIVTINLDNADFSYPSGSICISGTNPVPVVNSGLPGAFTASPQGLVFTDSTTGEINLGASTLGTYTVTFTSAGTCPNTSEQVISIVSAPDASFSYESPFCASDSTPMPVMDAGAIKGEFSASSSALVFVNTATGEIDLSSSSPGTYIITNYIAPSNGCAADTADFEITIQSLAIVDAGTNLMICTGEDAVLSGTIGGSATSATWSGGTGSFDNAADLNTTYTPSIDEIADGSVVLFLTTNDPAGPCGAAMDSVLITIRPEASVNAGLEQIICAGETVTLTGIIGGSATGGIWSGGTGTFSSESDLNAVYTPGSDDIAAGEVILTLTTTGSCDANSEDVIITIDPATTVSAGSDQTVCAGSEVLLSGSIGGMATSASWSTNGDGIFYNPDSLNTIYSPGMNDLAAGSVTLTLTTNDPIGSCAAKSAQIDVVFEKDDASFAYGSGTFCFTGANPELVVASGVTGLFSGNGVVFVNAASGQIDVTETPIGSYTITFVTDGICPDTAHTNITITDSPDASFSYSGSFCQNNENVLPEFSVGTSSGVFSATPSSGLTIDSLSGEINLSASDPGIYQITNFIEASGGCIEASASFEIEVLSIDHANAGSNIFICEGTTFAQLNGNVNGSETTGTWSTLGDGSFADSSNLQTTYTLGTQDIANGAVSIVLQTSNTNGCATASDTTLISYQQLPQVNAGNDTIICSINDGIQLSGSIIGGDGTGVWNTSGDGTFEFADSLNTLYIPGISDLTIQSVNLVLSAANSCLPESDSIKITIIPAPVVNAGEDMTICGNDSIILNGTFAYAGGGVWHSNGTGTFYPYNVAMPAQYIPTANDIAGGSMSIYLTAIDTTGYCPYITDTLALTFGAIPVADFFIQDTICEQTEIVFAGNYSTGIIEWQWNFYNENSFLGDTVNYTFMNAGSYEITLEVTNEQGCKDTITQNFVVNELPQAVFETVMMSCKDAHVQFNNQSLGDSLSWNWNFGDGNHSTDQHPVHEYATDGEYSVSLAIITNKGCASSVVNEIQVATTFFADFTSQTECSNYSASFTDLSVADDEIMSWLWLFDDGNTSSQQNPIHQFGSAGNYMVTLIINSGSGCADTISQAVNIQPSPFAEIEIIEYEYNTGQPITFSGSTAGIISWDWDFGDNYFDSGQEVIHVYNEVGTYSVTLFISDENGCSDSTLIFIDVNETVDITITTVNPAAIPNAFSPNHSGNNDVLYVRGGPFAQIEFRVYNEWGNLIFRSNNQQTGWDGSFKGKPQPAGVYVYIFTGRLDNGEIVRMSGDVTLIR